MIPTVSLIYELLKSLQIQQTRSLLFVILSLVVARHRLLTIEIPHGQPYFLTNFSRGSSAWRGPHRKHRCQQFSYCYMLIRCCRNVSTVPLPRSAPYFRLPGVMPQYLKTRFLPHRKYTASLLQRLAPVREALTLFCENVRNQ
jgi:hypothetical protein